VQHEPDSSGFAALGQVFLLHCSIIRVNAQQVTDRYRGEAAVIRAPVWRGTSPQNATMHRPSSPSPSSSDGTQARPVPQPRAAYAAFRTITTRWADNDAYGHVNNVVYYSWFDTAVNAYLIEQGALDIHHGDTIGLVIETQCNYFAPLAFPQTVEAGIRVARLGSSSVRYEVGLFAEGAATASAQGHFVHVYVGREDRRPRELPALLRKALEPLQRG